MIKGVFGYVVTAARWDVTERDIKRFRAVNNSVAKKYFKEFRKNKNWEWDHLILYRCNGRGRTRTSLDCSPLTPEQPYTV